MPISVFDLDHTLLRVNSSFRFGSHLFKRGKLSFLKSLVLVTCYVLHKCGFFSSFSLHRVAFGFLPRQEILKREVRNFLDSQLDQMLSPRLLSLFREARASGHRLLLLSNSPDFLVKEIAERLDFTDWAATRYRFSSDGAIQEREVMEGEAKAQFVKKWIKSQGCEGEKVTAYSDSIRDLPFLLQVDNPVAVNPDRSLKRAAQKRGWEIIIPA